MPAKKPLRVSLRTLPTSSDAVFAGPELVENTVLQVTSQNIASVIDSIKTSASDRDRLADRLAAEVHAAVSGHARPEEDGLAWSIIQTHTPPELWPSFTYFGAAVLRTIQWHVSLDCESVKGLLDDGVLEIVFD